MYLFRQEELLQKWHQDLCMIRVILSQIEVVQKGVIEEVQEAVQEAVIKEVHEAVIKEVQKALNNTIKLKI